MSDTIVDMPKGVYEKRFWEKVDKTPTCWKWKGSLGKKGYGRFRVGDRTEMAHRVAYELIVGAVPQGKTLDHLCRVRGCVNPAHLEAVSNAENVLRGVGPPAINAKRTHCVHGHEFSDANTYVHKGRRFCSQCSRDRLKKHRAARRSL